MVTMATQRLNEFELHARAILGLPVDTKLRECGASAVIYGGVEGQGLQFDGLQQAMSVPDSDIRLFGKPLSFEFRRMGVAIASGYDVEQARQKARLAASLVKPTLPS
jgi:phosphoribosylglycinamide formyltransferase 2